MLRWVYISSIFYGGPKGIPLAVANDNVVLSLGKAVDGGRVL